MISFLQGALNLRMTMKKDNVSIRPFVYKEKRKQEEILTRTSE